MQPGLLSAIELKSLKQIIWQVCTNTPGSYSCSCHEGFLLLPGSQPPVCKDIDECSLEPAICQQVL